MEIQLLAVRGLCSLIYSERVESASLLSRLILKWGSPAPGIFYKCLCLDNNNKFL